MIHCQLNGIGDTLQILNQNRVEQLHWSCNHIDLRRQNEAHFCHFHKHDLLSVWNPPSLWIINLDVCLLNYHFLALKISHLIQINIQALEIYCRLYSLKLYLLPVCEALPTLLTTCVQVRLHVLLLQPFPCQYPFPYCFIVLLSKATKQNKTSLMNSNSTLIHIHSVHRMLLDKNIQPCRLVLRWILISHLLWANRSAWQFFYVP